MKVPGTFDSTVVSVAELNALGHVFTSSTRPTGVEVYEGRRIYETDTSFVQSYDGAAWSPVGPVDGVLTDWTPQADQGASVNIAKSATYAKYSRVGRQIKASFRVTMSAAGTAGSVILVTLPVPAAAVPNSICIGTMIVQTAVPERFFLGAVTGITTARMQGFEYGAATAFGAAGYTIASGYIITGQLSYEAAS